MSKFIDLTSQKFGRLTVVCRAGSSKRSEATWNCVCDCGNEKIVTSSSLKIGNTKSCGCIFKEQIIARNKCMQKSIEERLEINIDKSSGRWIWNGGKDKDGYGIISYKGKISKAHRVIYMLFIGKIPKGVHVCHKNDTPWDVTPSNLFLGTHKDNCQDKVNKNRQARGETNGMSKLTKEIVIEIRNSKKTYIELAKKYNIDKSTVWSVKSKQTWKHI